MSHTTKAAGGTTFIHGGGYYGNVHILVRGIPGVVTDSADIKWGEVTVPFADLRELVYGYLRDKVREAVGNADDPVFEQMLIGWMLTATESIETQPPVTPVETKLSAYRDSTIREALRIAVTAAENDRQAERFEAALAAMDQEEA